MGLGLESKLDCGCGCGGAKKSDLVKLKYSFYSGLLFFIVSNPAFYKITGMNQTPVGLFVHSLFFTAVVFFLMKIGA